MQLAVILLIAFAALAAGEVHWDESGQYRLVDSEPIFHAPFVPLAHLAPLAPFAPLAPLAPIAPFAPVAPLAPLAPIAPLAPVAPLAPLAPIAVRLDGMRPFFYSYKQIKSQD